MEMIADGLLIAGALTAAFYCWILSSRVKGLTDLDDGLGSAIAALGRQVDELQAALRAVKEDNASAKTQLSDATLKAEDVSNRLNLLITSAEKTAYLLDQKPQNQDEKPQKETAHIKRFPTSVKSNLKDEAKELERQPAAKPERQKLSKAQKLKDDMADKLKNRANPDEREELVRALQDILAANE